MFKGADTRLTSIWADIHFLGIFGVSLNPFLSGACACGLRRRRNSRARRPAVPSSSASSFIWFDWPLYTSPRHVGTRRPSLLPHQSRQSANGLAESQCGATPDPVTFLGSACSDFLSQLPTPPSHHAATGAGERQQPPRANQGATLLCRAMVSATPAAAPATTALPPPRCLDLTRLLT